MADITIEGSLTPSTFLRRGERRTVRYTEQVQRKIDLGYVIVVGEHPEPTEIEVPEPEGGHPPKLNASREDWAEFLAQHPAGFVTEGKDRTELIAEWEAHVAGPDANDSQHDG